MPDYKHLQNLCDDVAAHLEAARIREQDGRGTYVEIQQAERSAIDLFRGIVRAGAEITAKRMAKATNGKDT